jgi:hypothetical protein
MEPKTGRSRVAFATETALDTQSAGEMTSPKSAHMAELATHTGVPEATSTACVGGLNTQAAGQGSD